MTESVFEKAENLDDTHRNHFKKRQSREKKFRNNAKGFARRGNFGRGTYIEEEKAKYFLNILDVLKNDFEDNEEILTLSNNVIEQTIGEELLLSSHQIASKVIENLIGFSDCQKLEGYLNAFSDDFRLPCSDQFASHVLQKLVNISFLRAMSKNTENIYQDSDIKKRKLIKANEREYNLRVNFPDDHIAICQNFVLRVSKFILNNLEDFVWDTYGNHVTRTCLLCLSSIYKKVAGARGHMEEYIDEDFLIPEEWTAVLKEYANRLRVWPQFIEFPYNELTSGLLQTLLRSLRRVDKNLLKSIGEFLISQSFLDNEHNIEEPKETLDESKDLSQLLIPKVFSTESSIRLLEVMLLSSGKKLFSKIFSLLFAQKLTQLSKMKSVNFAVQKLIDNFKRKEEFELAFDELAPEMESILQVGHTGVVLSLGQTCKTLNTRQFQFIKHLRTALHCPISQKEDKFVLALLKLKPLNVATNDSTNFVHIHGSLVLQSILSFHKPIEIIQSLLNIESTELISLLNTTKGSFIIDAFFQAPYVGEKSKIRLIKHLEGNYLELAVNKSGSRVLETMYENADLALKTGIVKELAEKLNQLESSHTGYILSKKFFIGIFKQSPNRWQSVHKKDKKADKLFKDILK